MKTRSVTPEVLYADEDVVQVTLELVAMLKQGALTNARKRMRLCAHPDADHSLHEMIIALAAGGYIQPHRHPGKSESFHMIEGCINVLLFSEDGTLTEIVSLGAPGGDLPFYYRISKPFYHTVLVVSPVAVFHETTNGPFDRANTVYAPWAPDDSDVEAGRAYLDGLTC